MAKYKNKKLVTNLLERICKASKYKQAYGYIWKYATNDDPELLENKQ